MLTGFEGFIGMHQNTFDFLWEQNDTVLDYDQVYEYYMNDDYSADIESMFYLSSFFLTGSEMVEKLTKEMNNTNDTDTIVKYANYINGINNNDEFDYYFWNVIEKNYVDDDLYSNEILVPVKARDVVDDSAYGYLIESDDE